MNDKELIRELRDKAEVEGAGSTRRLLELAARRIEDRQWMSVKDRLPKSIANKVLVWLEHEDLVGYIGFGHYEKYKGQEIWYDLEHNEAFSIRGYVVTHWMPMPTMPEADT